MTRAVQTGLVCLNGHYACENSGMVCMSAAREIKGVGGLDCLGRWRYPGSFLCCA